MMPSMIGFRINLNKNIPRRFRNNFDEKHDKLCQQMSIVHFCILYSEMKKSNSFAELISGFLFPYEQKFDHFLFLFLFRCI